MEKLLLVSVLFFIATEVMCVVALLTPEWLVSDFAGQYVHNMYYTALARLS